MTAAIALAALVLDRLLGEPGRWHPLVGFGALVDRVEAFCLGPDWPRGLQRGAGAFAWLLLVAVPGGLLWWLLRGMEGWLLAVVDVAVLYLALGHRSLAEHARAVAVPLAAGDLELARQRVAMLVSRETAALDEGGVAGATVESVLENGSDAIFAPLFWFALAGAPGVLVYRLANTLDARWGYRNPRYRDFGWASARCDDILNWLPARGCALSYTLAGRAGNALHCWRRQGPQTASPNAGPVMAAGAGALHIAVGGPARYGGEAHWRPVLGRGAPATGVDIERALGLVRRSIIIWLVVFMLLDLLVMGGDGWH